jgi:hypothetical protein
MTLGLLNKPTKVDLVPLAEVAWKLSHGNIKWARVMLYGFVFGWIVFFTVLFMALVSPHHATVEEQQQQVQQQQTTKEQIEQHYNDFNRCLEIHHYRNIEECK